ncbi:hypothetical protein EUX98_g8241 [Antrodiella citrinella]|uniref:Uncharacterized protein n=1 Tax=Antrodiella citrinella TaxID=2447956 RepID=A0A4V3XGN5_9APHY|nr:hypothetical protein EUX98_g8241 [Antrodiella citrinella]
MSSAIASLSRHTLRQLKFILPGGLLTLWLDSHNKFWRIFNGQAVSGSFPWTISFATLASALLTFVLFIYVLLFPLIQVLALEAVWYPVYSNPSTDSFDTGWMVVAHLFAGPVVGSRVPRGHDRRLWIVRTCVWVAGPDTRPESAETLKGDCYEYNIHTVEYLKMAELSNNPFIDHPSNALARFPDISSGESPYTGPFTSWLKPSGPGSAALTNTPSPGYGDGGLAVGAGGPPGYQQQVSQQTTGWNQPGAPQQYQQNSGFISQQPVQPQPTGRPFQPSSSFGQQLHGAVNSAYGIPSQQPQQQQIPQQQQQSQYTGYPTSPQYGPGYQPQYPQALQQQQTAQYLSEFDPYSQVGSLGQAQTSHTGPYGQGPGQGPGQGSSTYQHQHPRDHIRQHKAEMESWDSYTWKQSLQSFEALKEAWLSRKREIEARGKAMGGAGLFGASGYGYGGAYGQQAQELAHLEHHEHHERSRGPPPPQLPQELVDLVIDQIAHDDDVRTLQSCALAAASWLPRCRGHLFSTVYLHPNHYARTHARFASTLSTGVGIGHYVRHVFLKAGTSDEDEQPIPRDAELPASLLALFPNAEHYELINVRWGGLRPDVRAHFVDGAHGTVLALALREVAFPTLAELVRLVRALGGLKVLRMRNVVWEGDGGDGAYVRDDGGGGGRGRGRSPSLASSSSSANPQGPGASSDAAGGGGPRLEDLEMYECTSPGAFISRYFFSSTSDGVGASGERLQRLALDWRGREEDPAILRNLISDAGAALQILEVDLAWQQPAVPLDLSASTGLRSLFLDGLLLDDSDDSPTDPTAPSPMARHCIPTVLVGIASTRMRKLVFYVVLSYLNGLQRLDLEQVDAVLAQRRFATVECVGFGITILPISGVVPPKREEIWETIKRRMGRAEARGVLRLMRTGSGPDQITGDAGLPNTRKTTTGSTRTDSDRPPEDDDLDAATAVLFDPPNDEQTAFPPTSSIARPILSCIDCLTTSHAPYSNICPAFIFCNNTPNTHLP